MRRLGLLSLLLAGCAATGPGHPHVLAPGADEAPEVTTGPEGLDHRTLPVLDGASGEAIGFDGLVERLAAADVVVLGEQHDDAVGHGFQQSLIYALFERYPGSTLALEFIERDQQLLVADYASGVLDAKGLASALGRRGGRLQAEWLAWYQPMIDTALAGDGRVVGANAPRRYVRGVPKLEDAQVAELAPEQTALFDLPHGPQPEDYRQRFMDLMSGDGHGEPLPQERIEQMFLSQSMWDATMAASVVRAEPSTERKAVLVIGAFHSDFAGGTIGQIGHLAPDLEVLTVSVVREAADTLRDEDQGRADVVVFSGLPDA